MSQQQVQVGRRMDGAGSRLTEWTSTDRLAGRYSCYVFFGLALVYVPTMVAGFIAVGGLSAPIRDPYLGFMEVLILLLTVAIVVAFAALHAYAPASKKTLSLSALVLVALMAGITICVHFVLLTVGRQADETTLPGFKMLFTWTWPSMIYALDIAAWDFCLGVALILAAPVFSGSRPADRVRRGLIVSGVLCLGGLLGAVVGNMNVRNIGVVGYAFVLPIVMLRMGRLFAASPATDDRSGSPNGPTSKGTPGALATTSSAAETTAMNSAAAAATATDSVISRPLETQPISTMYDPEG